MFSSVFPIFPNCQVYDPTYILQIIITLPINSIVSTKYSTSTSAKLISVLALNFIDIKDLYIWQTNISLGTGLRTLHTN